MKKSIISKVFTIILCFAISLLVPLTTSAAVEKNLSILFRHDKQPIAGAVFNVYLIAEQDANGNYKLSDTFSKYPVSLNNLDEEGMNVLAATLAAYAARDKITDYVKVETNRYGVAKITGLTNALYLITGDSFVKDDTTYFPTPCIVSIPTEDIVGNVIYDVAVEPKYEFVTNNSGSVERKALKIWNDAGNEANRPADIVVQLLKNGEIYDEQVLNEANNWRCTWSGLDSSYRWQLVEKEVADGYTVGIEQKGITFTVTNTCNIPQEPTASSSVSPTPTANPAATPGKADKTKNKNGNNNEATGNNNKNTGVSGKNVFLPQTGILWWPVPVLISAGIILISTGLVINRRRGG